jgi:hypothetical protein
MFGSVRAGVEVFSGSFYGPPQGQRHPHKDLPFSDSGNLKQKDRPKTVRRDQTTAIASGRSTPPRGLLLNGDDVESGISALIKTEVSTPTTVEH